MWVGSRRERVDARREQGEIVFSYPVLIVASEKI
jgi:hypothetical protein